MQPLISHCIGQLLLTTFLALPLVAEQSVIEEAGSTIFNKVGKAIGGTAQGVAGAVSSTGDTLFGGKDVGEARAEIDAKADRALRRLLASSPAANRLFDKSYGYAAFDSRKVSLMLTTGTGSGVVVDRATGSRTYMHMATGGAGLGFGAQFFAVVFLFENKASMERFVRNGWEANAAATAVFGEDSLEHNVRFVEGMAVFQLNESGVMADLNLTGTKYWTSRELNGVH